ncbi:MAG: peptidase M48 [Alphaproteobacteria bacterium CG_4_10_14_0_2_um_filter_63_37]|nr:MAG: peptidase M48 [Proteobacteria bacterium CG1_02_64_396]PJA26029.1 MAG: peptidase M48 [Alphaproteobacteria bacterium CG_4_10_14_0_2_um_filter_63_37]
MSLFTSIFLALLALSLTVEWWLALRHIGFVARHAGQVPPRFEGAISLAEHTKAARYTGVNTRMSMWEVGIGALIVLGWTLGGGLNSLDQLWRTFALGPVVTGTGVLMSLALIGTVLEIPMTWWKTFKVESRFGFNRTTPALFWSDTLKNAVVMLAVTLPLAWVALLLMSAAGPLWWLWLWGVWMGFIVLMIWIYPTFIAPWFNTFNPLEDGELKRRIEALLARSGFTSQGIFVMDGSRRSSHGNAYFTGFGKSKRIVFYDTLIERLSPDEIEAVLAHELGHFKLHHIRRRLVLTGLTSLAALGILGWLAAEPWFYASLGVATPSPHGAIALFLLAMPVFSFFLDPLMALYSRQHEFEADRYAGQQTDRHDLVTALVKLYADNAATLTPDPLYSAFHDSHPPAPIRVARLEGE